jgi:hypothetical protein
MICRELGGRSWHWVLSLDRALVTNELFQLLIQNSKCCSDAPFLRVHGVYECLG